MSGSSAFRRLFTEQISSVDVQVGDEEVIPLEEALSRLQDPDRKVREEAAHATTAALRPGLRTRAYVFNTLLGDKATKDRLRDYPHWLASRNLANEGETNRYRPIDAVAARSDRPAGTGSRPACSASTAWPTGTGWRR